MTTRVSRTEHWISTSNKNFGKSWTCGLWPAWFQAQADLYEFYSINAISFTVKPYNPEGVGYHVLSYEPNRHDIVSQNDMERLMAEGKSVSGPFCKNLTLRVPASVFKRTPTKRPTSGLDSFLMELLYNAETPEPSNKVMISVSYDVTFHVPQLRRPTTANLAMPMGRLFTEPEMQRCNSVATVEHSATTQSTTTQVVVPQGKHVLAGLYVHDDMEDFSLTFDNNPIITWNRDTLNLEYHGPSPLSYAWSLYEQRVLPQHTSLTRGDFVMFHLFGDNPISTTLNFVMPTISDLIPFFVQVVDTLNYVLRGSAPIETPDGIRHPIGGLPSYSPLIFPLATQPASKTIENPVINVTPEAPRPTIAAPRPQTTRV